MQCALDVIDIGKTKIQLNAMNYTMTNIFARDNCKNVISILAFIIGMLSYAIF
jgi:hypothetical protein